MEGTDASADDFQKQMDQLVTGYRDRIWNGSSPRFVRQQLTAVVEQRNFTPTEIARMIIKHNDDLKGLQPPAFVDAITKLRNDKSKPTELQDVLWETTDPEGNPIAPYHLNRFSGLHHGDDCENGEHCTIGRPKADLVREHEQRQKKREVNS